MKIVCDTNIFVSSLEFGGTADALVKAAFMGKFQIITSAAILLETSEVLFEKFAWDQDKISRAIFNLSNLCKVVTPHKSLEVVVKDPDDNKILECALEGEADYIVTGDKKHLLPLKKFRKIPIITPAEFLKTIKYEEQ